MFLSSSDPDLPDIDAMIDEAEANIIEGVNTPVHFSIEYLDPSLFATDALYQKKLTAFLGEKHRGRSFDLVITIGDETQKFAEESLTQLFPEGALLFFATAGGDDVRRPSGATGVIRKVNYLTTLQLALRENPGTHRVIVICGSSGFEKFEVKVAREQFRAYEPDIKFQYWTDLQFTEVGTRLAHLEPDSVVLFLDFLSDPRGGQFTPSRILRTISKAANRPIYGTYSSFIGSGAVGGSAANLREVGRILGQDGVRILNGERAEDIPVTIGEFQRYMFDWRQLHRWGIAVDQLPPGSSVTHWEYSPWELYRWRIIGIASLVVAQTLLIVLLLASRARRRRAESALTRKEEERKLAVEDLKKSEEKFSKAFRQGPLGISLTSATTHRYIDVNETFARFVGYSRDELIGRSALEVGIWPDSAERTRLVEQLLVQSRLRDVEFQFRRRDGEIRVALASAELIEVAGEPCVLGVVTDITDRKRAGQALLESEKRFRLMADSAPVLMWLSGADKLCTDFNREWLRFTGRTMQQELGDGWVEGVHPDDVRSCLSTYVSAFDARQSFVTEYRLRRWDGQYRWMLDRGVPRFLEDGDFAGYIGCCIDVTDEKEAKAARAELGGKLIHAQEEERARIARELHDDINQRLALLANELEELQRASAGQGQPPREDLRNLSKLTGEIAGDIQHLSHELHPSKLHYLGLAAAVRELCREFARQHKIEIECQAHSLPRELDENASLSLFRTVQESLHNVAKHSQARHVTVELTPLPGAVRLRISDDGVGFDPNQPGNLGLGLVSMRERMRLVGGEFTIRSCPAVGTVVEACAPNPAKNSRSEPATAAEKPMSA